MRYLTTPIIAILVLIAINTFDNVAMLKKISRNYDKRIENVLVKDEVIETDTKVSSRLITNQKFQSKTNSTLNSKILNSDTTDITTMFSLDNLFHLSSKKTEQLFLRSDKSGDKKKTGRKSSTSESNISQVSKIVMNSSI